MITLYDVLDRAINTGPRMLVRDFDMKVFKVASRLAREHPDIKYDPNTPVPSDDSLADEAWEAGLEMFTEVGSYCMNSERLIKFDEQEIRDSLRGIRGEVVIGTGSETRVITKGRIGDTKPPNMIGGVVESDMPEGEAFVKLYQGIADIELLDGLYTGPPLRTAEGRPLRFGTPLDVHLGRYAAAWTREGIRRAGRPGLHFILASSSATADIAACDPAEGIRRSDALLSGVTSELKTDYECLTRAVFCGDYGCIKNVYAGSIIGGWGGGPEGSLITAIADSIMGMTVYQLRIGASYGMMGISRDSVTYPCVTGRKSIWGTALGGQAIARNTKLPNFAWVTTYAGPGTEMQFWEIAANAIANLSSGFRGICAGPRRMKVKPMLGSPLENRWYAEVGYAAAGLKRDEASEMVQKILAKYEDRVDPVEGGPWGHTFDKIYDLKTLTLRKEYVELYDRMSKELENLTGLKLR